MAPEGADDLYDYAKKLTGMDNIDLYISHGHSDHTAQIGDFVKAGRKVYINEKDIPMALSGVNDKTVTENNFTCISEGYQFDLGGVVLDNYDIPDIRGQHDAARARHTTFFIRPISLAAIAAALQTR